MNEYLLIPFDKKDEIKKDHPIKWDVAKKLWYFDTVENGVSSNQTGSVKSLKSKRMSTLLHTLLNSEINRP